MIPVGIVGFSGYSGAELVSILERHPQVEPVLLEHREAEDRARPLNYRGPRRLTFSTDTGLPLVFLATPPEVSIDLDSGPPRGGVQSDRFERGFPPGDGRKITGAGIRKPIPGPIFCAEAVYGLPEFFRADVAGKQLISNPGCYPTAANLALRPLLEAGVVDRNAGIVCDAKSGVSGAGRKPSLKTSFVEVTENFSAYSVLEHRHVPEILRTSGLEEIRAELHRAAAAH